MERLEGAPDLLTSLCIGMHRERKGFEMKGFEMRNSLLQSVRSKRGMELVQVAILVAIAVALGLIFKTQITDFVNRTFEGLSSFS